MKKKEKYHNVFVFIFSIICASIFPVIHAMEMEYDTVYDGSYQVDPDFFTPVIPVAVQSDTGLPIFPESTGFKTIIPVDQGMVRDTFWHICKAFNEKNIFKQSELFCTIKNNANEGALDYLAHAGDLSSVFIKIARLGESQFAGQRAAAPQLMNQAMHMLSKHFEYPFTGGCDPQILIRLCEVTGARSAIKQLRLQGYHGAAIVSEDVRLFLKNLREMHGKNNEKNSRCRENSWRKSTVETGDGDENIHQSNYPGFNESDSKKAFPVLSSMQNKSAVSIDPNKEMNEKFKNEVEEKKKNEGSPLQAQDQFKVSVATKTELQERSGKQSAGEITNDSDDNKKNIQDEFYREPIPEFTEIIKQLNNGQCSSSSKLNFNKRKVKNKKTSVLKNGNPIFNKFDSIDIIEEEKKQELSPEDLFNKLKTLYYGNQKNYKESLELCNQLLTVDKDAALGHEEIFAQAYAVRAELLAQGKKNNNNVVIKKNLKKAGLDYEKAIELGNVAVIQPYAQLLIKSNKIKEAKKLYERILADKVSPAMVKSEVAWKIALIEFNQDNMQEAIEKMCCAYRIHPNTDNFETFAQCIDGKTFQKLEKKVKRIELDKNCDPNELLLCYFFGRLCYQSKDERFVKRKKYGLDLVKLASENNIRHAQDFFATLNLDKKESAYRSLDLICKQLKSSDETTKERNLEDLERFGEQGYLRPLIIEFLGECAESRLDEFFSELEKKHYKDSVINADVYEYKAYHYLAKNNVIDVLEEQAKHNSAAAWLLARTYLAHAMNLFDDNQAQNFVQKATALLSGQKNKKSKKCRDLLEKSSDVYRIRNEKLNLEVNVEEVSAKKNKKRTLRDVQMENEEMLIAAFYKKGIDYNRAESLLEDKKYDEAIVILKDLADRRSYKGQLKLLELYVEHLHKLNSYYVISSHNDVKKYLKNLIHYWLLDGNISFSLPITQKRLGVLLHKLHKDTKSSDKDVSSYATDLFELFKNSILKFNIETLENIE